MSNEYFANLSLWFWLEIINHLWQSTLFLLLAMISITALKKSPAKGRYTVWLLASAKFALPLSMFAAFGQWLDIGSFLPHTVITEPQLYNSAGLVEIVSTYGTGAQVPILETAPTHNEIYYLLTLVWMIGCFGLFALWGKRSRLFRAILTGGSIPASSRETKLLRRLQRRLGLTSQVNLIISDSVAEPVVWGVWRPTIIIPPGLSKNLTKAEFESILIHELSHIANKDNLICILQMTLCCLLWFHPLVWLVKRRILEERERVCDETVIQHGSKSRIYATGLLKVVRFGLHSQQSAGLASATGADLRKRLELIMINKTKNTKTLRQRWVVGSVLTLLVSVCIAAGFATTRTSSSNPKTEPFTELTVAEQLNIKAGNSSAVVSLVDRTVKEAPLLVSAAQFKAIPADEYRNLIKNTQASDYRVNVVDGKVYTAFIKVRNTTNLSIRQCHLVIPSVGNIVVKLGEHEIKPGESRLLENLVITETWEPDVAERIISEGDSIAIEGVKFADGSGWGSLSSSSQRADEEKMYGIMVTPLNE